MPLFYTLSDFAPNTIFPQVFSPPNHVPSLVILSTTLCSRVLCVCEYNIIKLVLNICMEKEYSLNKNTNIISKKMVSATGKRQGTW